MATHSVSPATTLLHRSIRNRRGDRLGHIADLVIDIAQGSIAYALVAGESSPPQATDRSKLFVIPWSSFSIQPDEDAPLILDIEPEVFQHAPGLPLETVGS